ncbi:MAG: PTS system ascorbate-specific IIA component [Halothiobacillaceae bacterium]|nr:MAG: PTS system ascorbate-specific IIA component [Halothiobacillaceae bacterium]
MLTDIYGSTPSNIASALLTDTHMRAVAGLNLPMLIKVFNYPRLGIEALAQKAAEGGRDGIVAWDATEQV